MPRSLPERMKDWRWWGEQVLHFLAGWAIVWCGAVVLGAFRVPLDWLPTILVPLACFAGGVREIVQNWGDYDGSLGDSIVDLGAWCLGATVCGVAT
ncbi:MAG: hypothetical protein E4H01_15770 [Lysobacterales bacterium]|nr:MAG: hypothetical protein E4H01_15770 [Xanthomonadales bacterium]